MISPDSSAAHFDRLADGKDMLPAEGLAEAARQAAIAKAHLHPEMVAADVGAGSGFLTAGLAPRVRRVHVIDDARTMLDAARRNLAGFDNLEFHLADRRALPLPDRSLDVAFADLWPHDCPDPLAAIHEVVRTLRPGGRLVLTDLKRQDRTGARADTADVRRRFDRAQVRAWLEQAGLVNVIVESLPLVRRPEGRIEGAPPAAAGFFVATGTRRVPAHEAVQRAYAARALGAECGCGDSSCCSPGRISLEDVVAGDVRFDGGYSPAEMAALPAEAAEISLGCGNPTAMANLGPGEVVLDIGSGGGIDVFLAAQRVGPTGRVLGVDMTPSMLQRARRAAEAGGYTNVAFRHGYAEALPVDDSSVDVVLSNCVINLAEDKARAFAEALRVLRPGGRLEVNDMVFGGPVLPALRASAEGWSECISGALPEAEVLDLVRQAGFVAVSARRSTSSGEAGGVPVYSIQLSARKQAA